jgi:transposase
VERLTLVLVAVLGSFLACSPTDRDRYSAWDEAFGHRPAGFGQAVTALWISRYQEDPATHRFDRSSAWGQVPEKLVPDGQGGYSVAVPLLVQGETSDGPQPDRFQTVLVRVVRDGDRFALAPNDALPGEVVGWTDAAHRTVRFRGRSGASDPQQILWQFQGRY